MEIVGGTFDHNRAGQTYPIGPSSVKPGTGANPFRDNAAVRVTARSATEAAGPLVFQSCTFKNGYLAGLALIEASYAVISDCQFMDCTWNGLTFASARFLVVESSYFYRCGTYA